MQFEKDVEEIRGILQSGKPAGYIINVPTKGGAALHSRARMSNKIDLAGLMINLIKAESGIIKQVLADQAPDLLRDFPEPDFSTLQ
jgi:hypothetical protein